MKLIMCNECMDVVSLIPVEWRKCRCGQCSARHIDSLNAEFTGDATLMGFNNTSLRKSLSNVGSDFVAFTIKQPCNTFKKVLPI